MTYNHAAFIRDAMESILMQKTNFLVEIVVGDDFSTDETLNIIREYKGTENMHIKVLERNIGDAYWKKRKEIGRIYNFYNILENCRGTYISLLDGDDSWLDPFKLQKQVDYLEKNPDYSFVCGGYISMNASTRERKEIIKNQAHFQEADGFELNFQNMKKQWLTKTLTTTFRKEALDLNIFLKYKHARDINFFYHLIKAGKGYYFRQVFGIYNIHEGGINSMQQGLTNNKAAYLVYKELNEINSDNFTRTMSLFHTLNLFNFNLFNSYPANSFLSNIKLLKEAIQLIKFSGEWKYLFTAFFPVKFKQKIKEKLK